MSDKRLKLLIVIATTDRPSLLKKTLESLKNCSQPACFEGVLVVENGPAKSVQSICENFKSQLNTKYVYIPMRNKSVAYNAIIDSCGRSYLLYFIDDDVEVCRESIVALACAATRCSKKYFFGGPLDVCCDQPPPEWLKKFLPGSAKGWKLEGNEERIVSSKGFSGANWAAYADHLRMIGGFKTFLGPGQIASGQECQAQRELKKAGLYGYYVPNMKVVHYVPMARCTPAWTCQRGYRGAVHQGMLTKGVVNKIILLIFCYVKFSVRFFLYFLNLRLGKSEKIFKQIYAISCYKGYCKGLLLSLSNNSYQLP